VALSFAFDHLAARPTASHRALHRKAFEAVVMYLPISLGTIVLILVVIWLVRGF
jgi:hypothetical protein